MSNWMFITSLCVFAAVMMGCSGTKKEAGAEQDPWKKIFEKNGITMTVRYQPQAGTASAGAITPPGQSQAADTGRYFYFNVVIDKPGYEADKKTAEYLGYKMDSSFLFIAGGDTVMPAFWQNIASGRKGYFEYIVAFSNPQTSPTAQVMVKDDVFGLGRQYFVFNYKDLVNK
jgi:hypothetical protein